MIPLSQRKFLRYSIQKKPGDILFYGHNDLHGISPTYRVKVA